VVDVRGEGDEGLLSALLPDGSREEALVGGDPPSLRRLERRDPEGATSLLVRFDRVREVSGIPAAARLDLRAPATGNWLHIDWGRQEADPELPVDAFSWPGR
jgi:hypothetical protein